MPVEANNGNGAGAPSLEEDGKNIASAHHKSEFLEHPAIAFDLDLNFNGKDRFDARITMLTNSAKIHMDKPDGSSLVFTGENAYLSPKTAINEDARFNMFSWPYFFHCLTNLTIKGQTFGRWAKYNWTVKNGKPINSPLPVVLETLQTTGILFTLTKSYDTRGGIHSHLWWKRANHSRRKPTLHRL